MYDQGKSTCDIKSEVIENLKSIFEKGGLDLIIAFNFMECKKLYNFRKTKP